ncbi:glycine dehydrogenase (aminomethyl-transferring) [Pyrodictium delaneyi]|uniref:Probable glycine dehydrogenase (decarboxylating) subunit 1 n=1 Tax=Pyrodictium delaneyi TaxID=1273541 RepID=A0A211YS87_9CREN|nr:glycine dehydrogenase (aminomethyl-transferring) [Pyrodictium delaneyi]
MSINWCNTALQPRVSQSLRLPWAPAANERDRREMLKRIGVNDAMELYNDVPPEIMLKEPPNVGFGRQLSEWELQRLVDSMLSKNKVFTDPPPFLGGGICFHTVPAVIDAILSRSEFYTAYTPYQPEINQGLLQVFFEYQSLMADLLEMDVVNVSMYDWSTAAAEAILAAMRVTRKKRIVVAGNIHPERMEVIETWLLGKEADIRVVEFDRETGKVDLDRLENTIDSDTAAVYVEVPNFFGVIDDGVEAIAEIVHRRKALFIVGVDPLSLGIVRSPGSYEADIVVGDAQPLGLGLNYGGPYLGIFATRWDRKLVRQMPGRLIGLTKTVDGSEYGFTMILQTREQHIRREKATSNITSNEALMAVAAAAYMVLLGGSGLRELARSIWLRSHYAAKRLGELERAKAPQFSGEFFKEFTARFPKPYHSIHRALLEKGIMGGLPLADKPPLMDEYSALFCVTEAHSMKDIDRLVEAIGEML